MNLLFLVVSANAVPSFPAIVESELGMPCAPTCTLCHETNAGGTGTVTQPFGMAAEQAGMTREDTSLPGALAGMADVDSDGDGTTDIDELLAGENPNGGAAFCAEGEDPLPTPSYGCVNHAPAFAGLAGGLLAVLFGVRRTR